MSSRTDLERLSRDLDDGALPSLELERRIDSDAHSARRARALRRVDTLLRAELGSSARRSDRSIAALVVPRLEARARRALPRRWIAIASAAALLLIARPGSTPQQQPSAPVLVPVTWSWIAPALAAPIAPEQPLVTEARRLADDTRHAARSMWSSLPLSTWMRQPSWMLDER